MRVGLAGASLPRPVYELCHPKVHAFFFCHMVVILHFAPKTLSNVFLSSFQQLGSSGGFQFVIDRILVGVGKGRLRAHMM